MKRFFYILFLFPVFLTSCFSAFQEDDSGTYVVFSSNSRVAEKSVENLTNITLKGKCSSGLLERSWASWSELSNAKIELIPGDWDFTLQAFLDYTKFYAVAQVKINAGEENLVLFKLKELPLQIFLSPGNDDTLDYVTSIADAVDRMDDENKDYTIYISGILTGSQSINLTDTITAKSITLEGLEAGVIDGNSEGSTLTIDTTIPVIIKNLTITGGSTAVKESGGGITITSGATVKLADGVRIIGNENTSGDRSYPGGVYNSGTLFVYGSAVIGDASKTSAASSSEYSNYGSGIYTSSSGTLYLGYSDPEIKTPLTGGVYHNYGNAAVFSLGTTYMDSGSVSYNSAVGVFIKNNKTLTMTGGIISKNMGPGVSVGDYGTFNMYSGSITANTHSGYGGGVRLYNSSPVFNMYGGTISGNVSSQSGGGVGLDSTSSPKFTMTGGKISGNTAVTGNSFYKKGGTVTINDEVQSSTYQDEDIILD